MAGLVGIGKLKKESRRIDIQGNEIDPKSGEIIGNVESKTYVPTPDEVAILAAKKGGEEFNKEDLHKTEAKFSIENLIEKKIEAIIEKKISDVLEKMLK